MRIGFDLGGTKMLAGVLEDDNSVIARAKERTVAGSNDEVLSQIVAVVDAALTEAAVKTKHIEALGIAVPGPIDMQAGVVLDTPNIGVRDFPLAEALRERYDLPVFLENDVNAGLWGEFVAGSAQGYRHVIGVFPGTGLGGGLILDGHLYRGKRGSAGEIGHMIVQTDGRACGCGGIGCLETVASKTAIARDLVMLAAAGKAATVTAAGGTDITAIKSKVIKKAYESDGEHVQEVVNRAAHFLGVGLANVVNIFDPEVIVVGGGLVERFGTSYLERAVRTMRDRAMPRLVEGVVVKEATLGDDAAIVGAADLAAKHVREERP